MLIDMRLPTNTIYRRQHDTPSTWFGSLCALLLGTRLHVSQCHSVDPRGYYIVHLPRVGVVVMPDNQRAGDKRDGAARHLLDLPVDSLARGSNITYIE